MSFLIFLLLAGLISPALIPPRAACTVSANVVQVIELAPAVSEQLSQAQLPYTFLQLRIEVDYTPGQRALLASSPDGLGEPFTDDVMYLRARPSGKVFQHDFRSADRMAVGSIPPQDITFLFEPGVNTLELSTQDLTPPKFSTLPYYVLLLDCAESTATPSPTLTPSLTSTNTWTPTATETPLPTMTNMPLPTATLIPEPTATEILVPKPAHQPGWSLLAWVGVIGGIFGVVLMGAGIARLQARPRLSGEIEVYHAERFFRSYDLVQLNKADLEIGPQGDITLPDLPKGTPVGRIRAVRLSTDEVEIRAERLDPENPKFTLEVIPLIDGAVLHFGSYRLVYHNDHTPASSFANEDLFIEEEFDHD